MEVLKKDEIKCIFPKRDENSHKGNFGYVGIMGGSIEYSGAVKLANLSCASLTSGAGVVRLIVPEEIAISVMPYLLEQTLFTVQSKGGHMIFDKEKNPLPVFMGEREWFNSADVYAMEYSDIKDNHKILYGENLICSLNIKKEDLRLQCEAEMKNLLMRFRKHYLLFADNPKEINNALFSVTKTINAIFKAILRLKEIEVSKSAYANLNKICEIFDADKQFYEKLLCAKDRHCKFSKAETYKLADEAIMQLEKLLEFINNM